MSEAGNRRARLARASRRLATEPRLPLLAGVIPGLAALAEVLARTTTTQTIPAIAIPTGPTQSLRIGSTPVSFQAALVLCLLVLAATIPPGLLRPPAAAITVTLANTFELSLFHLVTIAGAVVQVVALYRCGRCGARWSAAAPALGLPFLILALAEARPPGPDTGALTVLLAALAPAAAWAGLTHRARAEALAHSAAREVAASTLLEHTARGERARIARELHDVVAHHISMIAVQAETARLATPGMPAAGAGRLLEIGDTARAALTEMRRLLGVLREDARATGPDGRPPDPPGADRRPQPSLHQLNDLLDHARNAARTGVRLIVSGPPVPLDPGVELAAYRIIQEALTNARRHAPGAAVDVELHYTPEVLRLRIRDNGPGLSPTQAAQAAQPGSGGHGLLGMHERAGAVGGRLRTGPATVGGFVVEATLPANAEVTP